METILLQCPRCEKFVRKNFYENGTSLFFCIKCNEIMEMVETNIIIPIIIRKKDNDNE